MSKKAALLVYQNLNSIEEDNSYWEKYIKFHELYWDGPNASQNVFYGREYEEYRDSLSSYLEIEPDQVKDCLFTKHENGEYYLTPLGIDSDKYIKESEDTIPPQWFFLFDDSEKKFFYSHAGDGAIQPDGIYYNTDSVHSKDRLNNAINGLAKLDIPKDLDYFIKDLQFGLSEMLIWISKFADDSMIVLNYAELTSVIHEFTLKNENSVKDMWSIYNLCTKGDFTKASSDLKIYKQKWDEISQKCTLVEQPATKEEPADSNIQ